MYNMLPVCFHLLLYLLVEISLYEALLQSPKILFSASYATYLTGEMVSLECHVSADFTIHGYKFFKNNQEVQRTEAPTVNKYKIRMVKTSDAGSYTCLYWISDSRGRQESEVSFPVSFSVIDQPSTPSLIVKPLQSLYFEGETVTLECKHPNINSQITYQFYKDASKLHRYHDTSMPEYHISNLSTKDSATYDCEYVVLGHQRIIPSGKSMQQTITVTGRLMKPEQKCTIAEQLNAKVGVYGPPTATQVQCQALSSSPLLKFLPSYSTFINGENLTMECEAPSPVHVTLYRFYKEGEELKGPLSHKGIYTLQNVTKNNQAEYTCMYWSPKINREIPSAQSPAKEIYVIDPLRAPLLLVDPPSGRIWTGGNVTLYCTAPEVYDRTIFHFLSNTNEMISVPTNKNQKTAEVTVNMKKFNSTSSIKFFCQYTAEIKGRSLLSPKGPQIEINVVERGSLLWLIAIGVGAGIAVLLVIIGLIYWILSGKKDSKTDKEEPKPVNDGGCKVTSL